MSKNNIFDVIAIYESSGRNDINKFILFVLILSVIGAGAAGFVYWNNLSANGISHDPEHWGQLGDFFGGLLNPLFGFLSVLILCYTLVIQFSESSKTARYNAIQAFESTLFELIGLHKSNLSSIDLYDDASGRTTVGKDCFIAFLSWIGKNFSQEQDKSKPLLKRIGDAYSGFYDGRKRKSEVGHYFRTLYLIFKYIDESDVLDEAGRMRYAKIVRAQLSSPELALLFFNGLHPRGENFRTYIVKYALLQDLDPSDINLAGLDDVEMRNIYGNSAFND